jgi:hypothetical protein
MAGLFELDYIFLDTKQNVKKVFKNYTDKKLCQRALQLAFLCLIVVEISYFASL